MTLYEQHIGRPMTLGEQIPEREFYISICLSKEQQKKRERTLKKEEPKQLTLFQSA